MPIYKKVLLKLSGESLGGDRGIGIENEVLNRYATEVKSIVDRGVEVAIVVGGGNIFRGVSGTSKGFDRVKGDQMGMLATIINSIALTSTITSLGVEAELFTATAMEPFATYYMRDKALALMSRGGVAIIAGGTGNPFFTTDSAAALRAAELGVSALLKGTRVDGVYNCDPEKESNAVKYSQLTFDRAIEERLKIMDQTAFSLCRENRIPVVVFNITTKGILNRIVEGEELGTTIKP